MKPQNVKRLLAEVIRASDKRRQESHRAGSVIDWVDAINRVAREHGLTDDDIAELWFPR